MEIKKEPHLFLKLPFLDDGEIILKEMPQKDRASLIELRIGRPGHKIEKKCSLSISEVVNKQTLHYNSLVLASACRPHALLMCYCI